MKLSFIHLAWGSRKKLFTSPKTCPFALRLILDWANTPSACSQRWKRLAEKSCCFFFPCSLLFFFFSSLWIMLPQLQSKFESWENTGAGLKRLAVTSQPKSGGSGFISLFSFLLPSAVIRNLNLTQTQAVLPREQWTDSEGGKYFFYCFFQCMRAWKTKHFGDTICVGYGDWGFLFLFFSWIRPVVAEPTFCLCARSVSVPAAHIWLLFSFRAGFSFWCFLDIKVVWKTFFYYYYYNRKADTVLSSRKKK